MRLNGVAYASVPDHRPLENRRKENKGVRMFADYGKIDWTKLGDREFN